LICRVLFFKWSQKQSINSVDLNILIGGKKDEETSYKVDA